MNLEGLALGPITSSLVVGEAGEHLGPDGTSRSLGGEADREWFLSLRRRAQAILTSKKTYLDENYKVPKSAALAVFSRTSTQDLPADVLAIGADKASDFHDALSSLLVDYRKIHCEFGPTGFSALCSNALVDSYLSSVSLSGIESFCATHELEYELLRTDRLRIARVGSVAVH